MITNQMETTISNVDMSKFDYQQLTPKTRDQIQELTLDIRNRLRRCAQDIYQIGYDLCLIKQELQHGQFRAWLKTEFDWSISAANKFMQVSRQFQPQDLETVDISPSALYVLAAPSTPQTVRNEALEKAKQGQTITFSLAKKLLKQERTAEQDDATLPENNGLDSYENRLINNTNRLPLEVNGADPHTLIKDPEDEFTEAVLVYDCESFNQYLEQEWRRMALTEQDLSAIVCSVTLPITKQLTPVATKVIQQISDGLAGTLKRTHDFVGQYSHDKCIAILPHTDADGAGYVANRFLRWLATWKREIAQVDSLKNITITLGVASMIPDQEVSSHVLIRMAESSLVNTETEPDN